MWGGCKRQKKKKREIKEGKLLGILPEFSVFSMNTGYE